MYQLGILRTTPKDTPRAAFVNQIVKDFISSTRREGAPLFCWIHYMDLHLPYLPYECYFRDKKFSYLELISKELPGFLSQKYFFKKPFEKFSRKYLGKTIDFYDQGIKYLDEQIGDLMEFLKKENIYQDALIFFVADHGDEFLEHQGAGHSTNLYNEVLRVPLLIKDKRSAPTVINRKVSLIDLCPTICNLGEAGKELAFKGKDLLIEKRDIIFHQAAVNPKDGWNASLTEIERLKQCKVGCQSDKWKYVFDYGSGKEELYDLIRDPKERDNLVDSCPEITTQMREKIKEFEKENPPLSLVG